MDYVHPLKNHLYSSADVFVYHLHTLEPYRSGPSTDKGPSPKSTSSSKDTHPIVVLKHHTAAPIHPPTCLCCNLPLAGFPRQSGLEMFHCS
jgi:hypothetical protein